VNRKLIRTTLADVKAKGRDAVQPREQRVNGSPARPSGGSSADGGGGGGGGAAAQRAAQAAAVQVRKRTPPPTETSAEIFYYKKQIDAHTLMVIVLQDEEIEGTIEWYDRNAIKVNRKGSPNLLILKHNIKYMYKADEREGE
jgi:sRNA-binding regulator protein Hfq